VALLPGEQPGPGREPEGFFLVGSEDRGELRIYLRHPLFRALDEFALRDTSREQAGLLLGRWEKGAEGPYLLVVEALEAGIGDGASRFSERSWSHARRVARHRYPDLKVVGWFHTHPGTGLDLSEEEKSVHRKFFPESYQVVYVVDPVRRERNFHAWNQGQLRACRGFRIYGKEEKMTAAPPEPARPDEHLRERYLERTLEKIQRDLRRPPGRWKDYLILGLLVALLLVEILRPAPAARVEMPSDVREGQAQMLEQITVLSKKVDKLEQHLAAMEVLEQEITQDTPSPEPPPPAPAASAPAPPPPAASPAAPTPGGRPPVGTRVRLHKVARGDTLSTICERYYKSSAPALVEALGRFNQLKPPNFNIYPGETLKIPDRKALKV
jgi:proteasome lid subunit RPN8/RPN11